ncbi:MAG TPA: hypothetical protein VEF04_16015, partial [Blastocatellia bacterium]|nr:hypothetical protein [Blastocatellia bacterium]
AFRGSKSILCHAEHRTIKRPKHPGRTCAAATASGRFNRLHENFRIMATKAQDTFTESSNTFIESHTPSPTGTGWTPSTTSDVTVLEASDDVRISAGANIRSAREGTDVGSDQMDVSADVVIASTSSAERIGVTGRYASGNHVNHYRALGQGATTVTRTILLTKQVAGADTALGTFTLTIAETSAVTTIKLEIRTAAKKVYTNGTERISSADDSLTGNNFAGIYGRGSVARLDNYLSESVSSTGLVKTYNGLATASVKTVNGLAIASVKTRSGLA